MGFPSYANFGKRSSKNNVFNDFEITRDFGAAVAAMLLNARVLRTAEAGAPERILLAIDDITDSKQLELMPFRRPLSTPI
jgi:hypothetical protein